MEKENKVKVKYPEIREVLQKLYRYAYESGIACCQEENQEKSDGYDFSTAYTEIEKILIENKVLENRLIFIGKDTWPVAGIIDKPVKTFIRRLILTRRIMKYKNWLKETGIKIEFNK